jgi:D-alanyl-lipoteichoic acid acyltransferase DltB (MBOAT superfamily)
MLRSSRPRIFLVASIVFTLGLLAFFKYAAFLVENTAPLTQGPLGYAPPLPEVLLPLGISFYSFQILALQIDSFRGAIEPPRSLARYALFVAFFPQLISGPILRGHEFLPQLERGGRLEPERTRRGLWLIASGLLKKAILGDYLLAPFVNEVYGNPGVASAPVQLVATYGFAFQIYFDFSGYTDMARGMACLLGFELPFNFREPYLSRNPAEFWRRWHTTLSRWLRDYLYIPLGGNRRGPARIYANLLLTMLLGGLWHGAGWNFVIWGGLHGLLLSVHRRLRRHPTDAERSFTPGDIPRVFALFHAVCLFWVFFRAETFGDALLILEKLLTGSYGVAWPVLPTAVVALCFGLHAAERGLRPRLPRIREWLGQGAFGGAIEGLALGAIAALAIAASGVGAEFIYFQF